MYRLFDFASQNSVLFIFIIMIPYIIALVLSLVYSKYNKIKVDSGLTGTQTAERILHSCRLMASDSASLKVIRIDGVMMNHYCPKDKESVHLSNQEIRDIKKILSVAATYVFISALSPKHTRGSRRVINYD